MPGVGCRVAVDLVEERLHLHARRFEPVGDLGDVAPIAHGLAPHACLEVDGPPGAAAHVPGAEIERRLREHEARSARRRERAPERDEVVPWRAESVEQNDDGAGARAFAIGAAGDASVEVAEFRELHGPFDLQVEPRKETWPLVPQVGGQVPRAKDSAAATGRRRGHFGGGGGEGSEHRPLTHWSLVLQQSPAVVHASYSCEHPFGVVLPHTSCPASPCSQKPPQQSAPVEQDDPVGLAGADGPVAAHVAGEQLLTGEIEGRVARILSGRRVRVDGGDPQLLGERLRPRLALVGERVAGEHVAVRAARREDDPVVATGRNRVHGRLVVELRVERLAGGRVDAVQGAGRQVAGPGSAESVELAQHRLLRARARSRARSPT